MVANAGRLQQLQRQLEYSVALEALAAAEPASAAAKAAAVATGAWIIVESTTTKTATESTANAASDLSTIEAIVRYVWILA